MLTDIALTNKFPPAHPPTRPTSNHAERTTRRHMTHWPQALFGWVIVVVVPEV